MRKWVFVFVLYSVLIGVFYVFVGTKSKHTQVSKKNTQKQQDPFFFLNSQTESFSTFYTPHPVTLNAIFQDDHTWTATLSASHVRTLIATGDIIPSRTVNAEAQARSDFLWPYHNISPILVSGDYTLINLETPLMAHCTSTRVGMIFCGSSKHMEGLKSMGVDGASFANNHMGNYGLVGVEETKKLLEKNSITPVGIINPTYVFIKDKKFAFLGYNDIGHKEASIAWADNDTIKNEIATAKKNSDVVVVMYHWGPEYIRQPHHRQVELAHLSIDSGADAVLGNHPHWIQPVELYKEKFIIYAHGNTVFDQMWSEETKYGVIGKYVFYDNTLVDVEYIPTYIKDYGETTVLHGVDKNRILQMLKTESIKLAKK